MAASQPQGSLGTASSCHQKRVQFHKGLTSLLAFDSKSIENHDPDDSFSVRCCEMVADDCRDTTIDGLEIP